MTTPSGFQVVIGAATWVVNGVNVFSANLARGLLAAGVPAHILLTEQQTDLVRTHEALMPFPPDVPFQSLPVSPFDGWGTHWGAMVRYLEQASPCVYIPNYDWRHSAVCPRLSNDVVIVGVVHSDDPLHYDHARRLGHTWNAIAAVSSAVAERVALECPAAADRIVTIPIGVQIPETFRARGERTGPLRLVYHGALKQHQKRVLDLPKIVSATDSLGVPVQLSIAGGGPDEEALRRASAPLVERGLIRFLGVVAPDEIPGLLESQDVYLLASEFEGMPNALIEAMGRGCVPMVTDTASGIPELIHDGENGFLAPIGDTGVFADRLRTLWRDPDRLRQMSRRAWDTVRQSRYRVEAMVESYGQVFERARDDVRTGRFVRPIGRLSPPPASIAGVSVFPVPLPFVEPGVGCFPSADDAQDFQEQERAAIRGSVASGGSAHDQPRPRTPLPPLDDIRVIVSVRAWTGGATHAWSEDLVRGLQEAGLDARLLLTEEEPAAEARPNAPRVAWPTDLRVETLDISHIGEGHTGEADAGPAADRGLLAALEASAPCIYLPGDDWRHAGIWPALSDQVIVIGTLHDVGPAATNCAAQWGDYLNAVVATNRPVARHIRRLLPQLEAKLSIIPHGLTVPAGVEAPSLDPDGRFNVLLVAPGDNGGDEAAWAAPLTRWLAEHQPARVVRVDGGAMLNREEWFKTCSACRFVVTGVPDEETRRMTVEAMGHGCIPLVVHDDGRGWEAVAQRIAQIQADADEIARLADQAHRSAWTAGYRTDQMIDAYRELFQRVVADAAAGRFRRPRTPPPPQVAR